jgi:hypothetical protein
MYEQPGAQKSPFHTVRYSSRVPVHDVVCRWIAIVKKPGVLNPTPDPVRVSIMWQDPDRHLWHADLDPALDRYQFQANEKVEKLK